MTGANNMRRYLKLFEKAAPDYVGPKASDTVSYAAEQTKGQVTKIVATMKSYDSGRYTRLGRNLVRITELTEEINTLQKETKAEARELVADVFNAEDAACTRVVDTVSFVFQLSKDPVAYGSVSYASVLKELESHLTPELIEVLETLKSKHTSAPVQRAASLKAIDKSAQTEESIVEGLGDKLVGFFKKLYQDIKAWGVSYDSKLDSLKAQVGITEELEEDDLATKKPNLRTSSDVRFSEKDLRAVHKDGWEKGRKTSPSYKGPYSASFWDHSPIRAQLKLGPRGRVQEGWAEERLAFHSEIASKMGEPLSDLLIDAIEAAAVTQDEWNRDPMGCKQRIRGAQEELYDFESIEENQEDNGWYTHHEMYGKISKEDWKKGWRYNHLKVKPFYNSSTKTWHDTIGEGLSEGFNVGDMVCATNPKATPGYEVLSKNADSYTLRHRYRDTPITLSKERIHRVNDARKALTAEPVNEDSSSEFKVYDIVRINAPRSQLHGEYGHIDSIQDGDKFKVILIGTGYWAMYEAHELEMSSREEAMVAYRQPAAVSESDECDHEWVEGVDDNGELIEPAYDVCVNCGEERH